MLGVPPMMGFAGRWRLYQTASSISHWLLAAFILSSMFALIAYVRCLTTNWWGPREEEGTATTAETPLYRLALLVLIVLLLAGGLWPDAALAFTRGIQ